VQWLEQRVHITAQRAYVAQLLSLAACKAACIAADNDNSSATGQLGNVACKGTGIASALQAAAAVNNAVRCVQ
jgi:hypothetical protein